MRAIVAGGGRINQVYRRPHAPAAGYRGRKPQPGMLLEAAAENGINLGRSILIGDALTDLEGGWRAGLSTVGLVPTGRGRRQVRLPRAQKLDPLTIWPLPCSTWSSGGTGTSSAPDKQKSPAEPGFVHSTMVVSYFMR